MIMPDFPLYRIAVPIPQRRGGKEEAIGPHHATKRRKQSQGTRTQQQNVSVIPPFVYVPSAILLYIGLDHSH